MWPLLICSIITVATALERLFFIIRERARRKPQIVEKILERVEHHDLDDAIKIGSDNQDFVARVLTFALAHRAESFSSAVLRGANLELKKFNRGLAVLDTIVTLAPLLVFVFWIGLHPQPFIHVMHASVQHLLEQTNGPLAPAAVALR